MSFVPHVVAPRPDIVDVYGNNTNNLLEKSAVSNVVGLLQQLNVISQFAAEIMTELLEDTKKQTKRIEVVQTRRTKLETHVPRTELMFVSTAPSEFYDNPYTGAEWKRKDYPRGGFFQRGRSPLPVNHRRAQAAPVPDLSSLDGFNSGEPCVKSYSDPDFFVNQWLQQEQAKFLAHREKREKKVRRRPHNRNKPERSRVPVVLKPEYRPDGTVGKRQETFVETDSMDGLEKLTAKHSRMGGSERRGHRDLNVQRRPVVPDSRDQIPHETSHFGRLSNSTQPIEISSTVSNDQSGPVEVVEESVVAPRPVVRRKSPTQVALEQKLREVQQEVVLAPPPVPSVVSRPDAVSDSIVSNEDGTSGMEIPPSRLALMESLRAPGRRLNPVVRREKVEKKTKQDALLESIRNGDMARSLRPASERVVGTSAPSEVNPIFDVLEKLRGFVAGSDTEDSGSESGDEWLS